MRFNSFSKEGLERLARGMSDCSLKSLQMDIKFLAGELLRLDGAVLEGERREGGKVYVCPHGWRRYVPWLVEWPWYKTGDHRGFKDGEYAPCGCYLGATGVVPREAFSRAHRPMGSRS